MLVLNWFFALNHIAKVNFKSQFPMLAYINLRPMGKSDFQFIFKLIQDPGLLVSILELKSIYIFKFYRGAYQVKSFLR